MRTKLPRDLTRKAPGVKGDRLVIYDKAGRWSPSPEVTAVSTAGDRIVLQGVVMLHNVKPDVPVEVVS